MNIIHHTDLISILYAVQLYYFSAQENDEIKKQTNIITKYLYLKYILLKYLFYYHYIYLLYYIY